LANIKSSKKDILRSKRNRVRNASWRSRLKTEVRKSRAALEDKAPEATTQVLSTARLLDKAATKGVIHPRQAARRKSRLARQLAKTAG
jgi:small subunit ribosomal protein S20